MVQGYFARLVEQVCGEFVSRRGRKDVRKAGDVRRRTRVAHDTLEPRTLLSVTVTTPTTAIFTEQGPFRVVNGGVTGLTSQGNPIIGALNAIATKPSDPNFMLVGSINGGIWKTTNATWSPNNGVDDDGVPGNEASEQPSWKPVGQGLVSLSITTLNMDPADPDGKTFYAGTGGTLSSGRSGGEPGHIYRSTDDGETWVEIGKLPETPNGTQPVSDIVATGKVLDTNDPTGSEIILAATKDPTGDRGAMYISLDSGRTWSLRSGSNGLPLGPVSSLLKDPSTPGTLYAGIAGDYTNALSVNPNKKGIYKSVDFGQHWTNVFNGLVNRPAMTRIVMSGASYTAPTPQTVLWAAVAEATVTPTGTVEKLAHIYNSTDGGNTWNANSNVPFAGDQTELHLVITPSPGSPNIAYVGGSTTSANTVYGGIHAVLSVGASTVVTTVPPAQPHADNRRLISDGAGNLVLLCDGGIYRLRNADNAAARQWESMNGDLRVAESSFAVAYDPINRVAFTGLQDNGSVQQSVDASGNVVPGVWEQVFGGDGNIQDVAVTTRAGQEVVVRYYLANNYGINTPPTTSWLVRRTYLTDASGAPNKLFESTFVKLASPTNPVLFLSGLNANENLNGFWRVPFTVNEVNQKSLLFSEFNLYISENQGDTIRQITVPGQTNNIYTAVSFGYKAAADSTADEFYAAQGNVIHHGVRTNGTWNVASVTPPSVTSVIDLVRDPLDKAVVWGVDDQQDIIFTADSGTSWQRMQMSIDGGKARVLSLAVIGSGTTRYLVAGTTEGLWRAEITNFAGLVASPTGVDFRRFGNIPNVLVPDVDYIPPVFKNGVRRKNAANVELGDQLVISTKGRGVWTLDNAAAIVAAQSKVVLTGDGSDDYVQIGIDAATRNQYRIVVNNVVDPTLSLPLGSIDTLEFNGNGGKDTLDISGLAGVAPIKSIKFVGGAGANVIAFTDTDKYTVIPPSGGAVNGDYVILGPGILQSVNVSGGATFTKAAPDLLAALQGGLQSTDGFTEKLAEPDSGIAIAGIGGSINSVLGGSTSVPAELEDDIEEGAALPSVDQFTTGTSILHRLLTEGSNPLELTDIGTKYKTAQEIAQAFDDLDDVAGNVNFTQSASGLRFDVRIVRTLTGLSQAQVNALGGAVSLYGRMDLAADVSAHLVFGVDSGGFYIDPAAPKDSGGNPEPEFQITNIRTQTPIVASGRLGFLEVFVDDGEFSAPDVKLSINLVNPGVDPILGGDDGLIRVQELGQSLAKLATFELDGGSSGKDVTITGTFEVAAVMPGGEGEGAEPPFDLFDAKLNLVWANVHDVTTVQLQVAAGAGADAAQLIEFAKRGVSDLITGLHAAAEVAMRFNKAGLLDKQIPVLGKSFGELLKENPAPLVLNNSGATGTIVDIGQGYVQNASRLFRFSFEGVSLTNLGINVQANVTVKAAGGGTLTGKVESVSQDELVLRFPTGSVAEPDRVNPEITVTRKGGLEKQMEALLAPFDDISAATVRLPTLQELIRELARLAGVDPDEIPVTWDPATSSLFITPEFTLDSISYSTPLDLSAAVPGLSLSTSGKFDVSVTPTVRIPIGITLGSGLAWEDRTFLAATDDPFISLEVSASLDNPTLKGSVGFLDVTLAEDGSPGNHGVQLDGSFGLKLLSPSNNSKLTIKELSKPLTDIVDTSVNATLDIDPLVLKADVIGSNLGQLKIQLDNYTINSLASLTALPSALASGVTGNLASFTDFSNITPAMIIQGLKTLVQKLSDLGIGGDWADKPLPLINKSINQILDLGEEFAKKLGSVDGVDTATIATAKGVQALLQAKFGPGVTISVQNGQVAFNIDFSAAILQTLPLNFDLGGGKSIVAADADGKLTLTAGLQAKLGLGFFTQSGLQIADRVFLVDGPGHEVSLTAKANVGYDVNNVPTAPLTATMNAFGKQFGIINGRAQIDLSLTGDIGGGANNDGRLTFTEIGQAVANGTFSQAFTTSFTGTAQALLPLDGNGDALVSYPNPSGGDALIQIGGNIADLIGGGIEVRTNPAVGQGLPQPANPGKPLTAAQFIPGKFVVATYNLDGFVTAGLLDFGTIFDGLEKFLSFGGSVLGVNLLDFKLPLLGKTPREVFDFFDSKDVGSIGGLVQTLKQDGAAAAGKKLTNEAVYAAALLLRDVLNNVPGLTAIADADGDGVVENGPADGDDLVMITRSGAFTDLPATGATFSALTGNKFKITAPTVNFPTGGTVVGSPVSYIDANGAAATGKVTRVADHDIDVLPDSSDFTIAKAGTVPNVSVQVEISAVQILAKYTPATFTKSLNFDLGLDALNLTGDFAVNFIGSFDLLLGVGISKQDGFFVRTDFSDLPKSTIPANAPELQLNGKVEVHGNGSMKLGFLALQAEMVDNPDGSARNFLSTQLGVNFNGLGDNKLTLAELTNAGNLTNIVKLNDSVDRGLQFNVLAGLDIKFTTALTDPKDPSKPNELPSLSTNLVLKWQKLGAPDGTPFDPIALKGVPTPYVALKSIRLNAGSFFDRIVNPVFKEIDKYNVLKPIIDVLDDELPIIGKTIFEILIEPLPESEKKTAMFLFQLASTISDAGERGAANQANFLDFGDFVILDPSAPNAPVTANSAAAPGKKPPASVPGAGLPFVGDYVTSLAQIGITFPVLDLTNLVNYILGKDVDLVFVNLPTIKLEQNFNITVPLFSYGIPYIADVYVEAFFGGGLSLTIDFDAGFDTRGLRSGHSILDGIYIGDFDPGANGIIDPTDKEKYEVALDVNIFAGINAGVRLFGFPVGQVTGKGTIGAEIGIDLNDDNQAADGTPFDTRSLSDRTDGKFHLDEISTVLSVYGDNPLCLFDLGGRLYARLDITAKVDLLFTKIEKTWGQEWTLLEFEAICQPTPPDLANLVKEGPKVVLELTSVNSDDDDLHAGTNGNDNIQIVLVDRNSNAEDGVPVLNLAAAAVAVTPAGGGKYKIASNNPASQWTRRGLAEGQRVRYTSGGNQVFGTATNVTDAGFDLALDTPALIPDAGTTFTVLSGKETLRVIKEHSQEDFGPAEDGANQIADISTITLLRTGGVLKSLGGGDDILFIDPLLLADVDVDLGEGSDKITIGSGGGRVVGGKGNDTVLMAAAPSDLTAAERLKRSLFADMGEGDDTVTAGPGNDTLLGGEGNDILDGGGTQAKVTSLDDPYNASIGDSGNDTLIGGGGDDILQARGGDDLVVGDYATGFDPLPSDLARHEGKDFIDAGTGNDRIWGDNYDGLSNADGPEAYASNMANDTIQAGDGNDTVFAGSGDDEVHGSAGTDLLYGGSGNDALFGEEDNDTMLGGYGNDFLSDDQGDNQFFGGWHNDVIRGGPGIDYVEGGPGDDDICTFGGDDTVYGGTAALGLPFLGATPAYTYLPGGFKALSCDTLPVYSSTPLSFLVPTGTLSGRVFNDTNGNALRDNTEKGLNSWTIEVYDDHNTLVTTVKTGPLDINGDGSIDPLTETGIYSIPDLQPGQYTLHIVTGGSYVVSTPPGGNRTVTAKAGDDNNANDFGVYLKSSISGTKFADLNGNGVRDNGEPGVANVTIYLDLNNNGLLDAGEPSTVTRSDNPNTADDETGTYTLPDLLPGTYSLREVTPSGYVSSDSLTVYTNDFSSVVGSEWSIPSSIKGTKGNGFLGDFSAGTATLTLTSLPAHDFVTIEFDLAILGSWDGNIGPDAFLAAIRNQAPFLYSTFANALQGTQSWPGPNSAPYSNAFSIASLGFGTNADGSPADALYHVCFTLPHSQASLILDLTAQGINGFGKGDDMVLESFRLLGDFNGDRKVDSADSAIFSATLNRKSPDAKYNPAADFDADGDVDGVDYARFRKNLGKTLAAPASPFVPVTGTIGGLTATLSVDTRSVAASVTATFSGDVSSSISVDDLRVVDLSTGQAIPAASMKLSYDSLARRAVWTFPGLPVGMLSDANYRFSLVATSITAPKGGDAAGFNYLNGNSEETYEAWGIDNLSVSLHGLSRTVTVAGSPDLTGIDLANTPYGAEVSGTVFYDANNNGSQDTGENGLPGIKLFADLNNNGLFDAGEPVTTSMSSPLGAYHLTGLSAGTVRVRVVPNQAVTVSTPSSGVQTYTLRAGQCAEGLNFGISGGRVTSILSGVVFNDANSNGLREDTEQGFVGARVYADYNNNGVYDAASEPSVLSGTGGAWSLNAVAGNVRLRVSVERLSVTAPATGYIDVSTAGPGDQATGLVFGVGRRLLASPVAAAASASFDAGSSSVTATSAAGTPPVYAGFVFYDFDGNGLWTDNEPRLDNWNINATSYATNTGAGFPPNVFSLTTSTFDTNNDGVLNIPLEQGTVALFANQFSYPYTGVTFNLQLKPGWFNTTLTTVSLAPSPSGIAIFGFGVRYDSTERTGDFTGTVWTDVNGNAKRDPGEIGLAGIKVYIDANNNGVRDTGELFSETSLDNPFGPEGIDEGGQYVFKNLPAGTYTIRQELPDNYLQTYPTTGPVPGAYVVSFTPGVPGLPAYDFGDREIVELPDGSDKIETHEGNDFIYGDNTTTLPAWLKSTGKADTIDAGDDNDTVVGNQGNDTIYGGDGADLLLGSLDDDYIAGEGGNDTVSGEAGNDTLLGGAGSDSVLGGAGDDTYVFADSTSPTTDTLYEVAGAGSDTLDFRAVTSNVTMSLTSSLALRATNLTIALYKDLSFGDGSPNFENVLGSLTNQNTLTGNAADNLLVGGNVADTLTGNDGNDSLVGLAGNDLLTGGNNNDRLDGGLGADILLGGAGDDTYLFTDTFGSDTLSETSGNDTLDFSSASSPIDFNIGPSLAAAQGSSLIVTNRDYEKLIGGSGNDNFFVFDVSSPVTPVTVDGGPGTDTLNYTIYSAAVTVNLAAGTATGTAGVFNIENVVGSSIAPNTLTGDANPNQLTGGDLSDSILGGGGNDTITALGGVDTLKGEDGDDTIYGGDGNDSISGGNGNDALYGGGNDDVLSGDAGNDSLYGNDGKDTLQGGADDDLLDGGNGDDSLAGDTGNDTLLGGFGNDKLNGGADNDSLQGGFDNDTYLLPAGSNFDNLTDIFGVDTLDYTGAVGTVSMITTDANTGLAGVGADLVTFNGIDQITATSAAANTIQGKAAGSTFNLTGANTGNVDGIGFTGFGTLTGSTGHDTFQLSPGASLTGSIKGGSGTDTLIAPNSVNTWNITAANAGIVNGVSFSSIENLTGNALPDIFNFAPGGSLSGLLSGAGSADTLNFSTFGSAITLNLASSTATGVSSFSSIESFAGSALAGDKVIGPNTPNTWYLTGANTFTLDVLSFSGFEHLTGGSSTDTFKFNPGTSLAGILDGGPGTDTLDYSAFGAPFTVSIPSNTATGTAGITNVETFTPSPLSPATPIVTSTPTVLSTLFSKKTVTPKTTLLNIALFAKVNNSAQVGPLFI